MGSVTCKRLQSTTGHVEKARDLQTTEAMSSSLSILSCPTSFSASFLISTHQSPNRHLSPKRNDTTANMPDQVPTEPPPSYSQATGSSTSSRPHASSAAGTSARLEVPGQSSNDIPLEHRRSMEDEQRPLPEGWVRTFDAATEHQFFVDTTKDPPRSIWTHPYDDDEYLSTLKGEERERIEQLSIGPKNGAQPSNDELLASHTDESDDDDHHPGRRPSQKPSASSSAIPTDLPPRNAGDSSSVGKAKDGRSFGRKFKDKVTGTTHDEREAARARRAKEELEIYQRHVRVRQAMARAVQTGEPQHIGKDSRGRDIYIEPPRYPAPGRAGHAVPGDAFGFSPYGAGGMYSAPGFVRPGYPYARPVRRGYGGGYGGGMGLPLVGGLAGGMLLGGALF